MATSLRKVLVLGLGIGVALLAGCASDAGAGDDEGGGDPDLGGPLSALPQAVGETASGPMAVAGSSTEVWSVEHNWTDTDPETGKSFQLAYVDWVNSFEKVKGQNYGDTIQLTTPYGKTLPGPALECSEVALTLRIAYSAWHHLPFYLTGWDDRGKRPLYAGHMGVVDGSGNPIAGFPRYKAQYQDLESRWHDGQAWPHDAKLRAKRLGTDGADENKFLGDGLGAGAYMDELFLNKRAGYFLLMVLDYFGSMNLADSANMIHVKADKMEVGDVLLERFQKNGIGHTLPVVKVKHTSGGHLGVSVASGSMPRRQPLWQDTDECKYTFTSDVCGGKGSASDGTPYAALGGGLRRWRIAVNTGGRWTNIRSAMDKDAYIAATDLNAISARPDQFKDLLSDGTPEEQRDAAIRAIDAARTKLKEHPASCSARSAREEAFQALYDISSKSFNMDKNAVDKEYRKLEDHVFSELEYTKSKTCCWNSTTTKMADLVLAYAADEQAKAAANQQCAEPTTFKAENGGYARWATYAQSKGQSSDWLAWSEDEPCAQKDVQQDTETARANVSWCTAAP